MTSKQRMQLVLNHDIPDRVPVDLGGWQSGICYDAYNRLKDLLQLQGETVLLERMQGLALPDDAILRRFNIDTRYVFPVKLSGEDSVPRENHAFTDAWGIEWHRPKGSHYYDCRKAALSNARTAADITKHSWPSAEILCQEEATVEAVDRINHREFAVFTSIASVFEQATYVRGMERFYVDLVTDIEFVEKLLDRVLEVELAGYEKYFSIAGGVLDVVEFWNDFGSQTGPLISPDFFRRHIMPREKQLMAFTREKTNARIALHSCGSVYEFIPDFIDMGVEILNPVQTTARHMEAETLKREFGKDLVFWGAIDTQRVLPFQDTDAVRKDVLEKIEALGKNGGYIIAPCHNIQNNTPPENIIALFDAAAEYGWYE
jgi:uroporphyrinogen decarboxylase